MRPLNLTLPPGQKRGCIMAQNRLGQVKKKTAVCRRLVKVNVPAKFEVVESRFACEGGTLPKDSR